MTDPIFSVGEIIKNSYDQTSAGLILGITYGLKNSISKDLYNNFKLAGVSHMVVFSGANIVIFFSLISKLLSYIKNKLNLLLSSIILIGFLSFMKMDPSIQRAIFMWGVITTAKILNKSTNLLYVLLLSSLFLLILDTSLIESVSFQLSVLALFGILIFNNDVLEINNKSEILRLIQTTLAAQVFTTPLSYYYFNTFNPLTLISNILISPLIPFYVFLGIFSPMILTLSKELNYVFCFLALISSQYIVFVLLFISKFSI